MKCKCGNEWVYKKHSQGDMLVCDTCNVGWDADDVISELKAENELLREALRSLVEGEGKLGCIHSRKLAKAILEENNDE